MLAQSQAPASASGGLAAAPRKEKDYSWDWMKWFQENDRHVISASGFDKLQNLLESRNSFANQATRPTSKIAWDEWRAKIKDPTFVESLRANYCAEMDIATSRTSPAQELTWSPEAQAEQIKKYQEELAKVGLKWTDDEVKDFFCDGSKKKQEAWMEWAKTLDDDYVDNKRNAYLNFEQAEAERDLFGYRGEMMDLAEHPQAAEMAEEQMAGKQTYSDKLLFEHEFHRYHKRMRLAQCQSDQEREIFLNNYKRTIAIHGHPGMDTA